MGESRALIAPDQGIILSRKQRHIPLHGKPSRLTIAVTGSTVLTAAAASGVVALWPATVAARPAADTTAARAAGSLQLDSSGAVAAQQMTKADFAIRQRQVVVLVAEEAAARRAAAEKQAAERAAAAAAAAQQQAAQQQQPQPQPSQAAPAPVTPSGSAQQIALGMLGSYGWSSSQFSCLASLWNQESGWNVYASNPSSGAYGIPQALPGSKMASAGPDWQTDAATQIRWGLGYIKSLYGSPCGAWAHEEADGWY
ncbi:MAG TPA: lytic transglycosylase domain-containing protein [Streptosporangiaceae bacterium]|nr:lytic transglycosylase domain-containing protein [Streptosporangiaceae bacterium]